MADARARGWGDPGTPGTASAVLYRKQHIVTIDVGGVRLSVRREVAPLFAGFIMEIVKGGYDLAGRADDWGYASRYIRGYEAQKILSNHAWGLAIDLNASEHPLGQRGTGVPPFVVDAAHKWGLSWGGDYKHRPDEMHFEFLGTLKDAEKLVESLTLHPAPHPEVDVFEPFVVMIPPVNDKGTQIQGHDINGRELGAFDNDVTVSIKANNDSTPVRCQVQPFGFGGKLALSFFREDGKPATQGQVLVIIGHPTR